MRYNLPSYLIANSIGTIIRKAVASFSRWFRLHQVFDVKDVGVTVLNVTGFCEYKYIFSYFFLKITYSLSSTH